MEKLKLKWKVSEEPTGRYRSFEKRSWPTAYYGSENGKPAAFIYCSESYTAQRAKSGECELKIVILNHNQDYVKSKGLTAWVRCTLKKTVKTVAEAKETVYAFLESRPHWWPVG